MFAWLAVTGILAWGLYRIFGGYPRPESPPACLWARVAAFIGAAADTTFPAGGAVSPSGRDAGVIEYTDRYLAAVPGPTRLLMHLLFFLVEHATLFFPAPGWSGARRFSSLDTEQQLAALQGWERSGLFPRRLVFSSLRAILTMGYFADPTVLRMLSLAPHAIESPVVEADLLYPRIGQRPETIAWTRADLTPPGEAQPLRPSDPLHADFAERS